MPFFSFCEHIRKKFNYYFLTLLLTDFKSKDIHTKWKTWGVFCLFVIHSFFLQESANWGWASEFLNTFPNRASNISYSYVFLGPETFLISAFYLFLSVKYTLSPLRILKFNPKSCFYPLKASYFLWILRYEAGLFLRYFLNFLTFWAWLSYKMVSYKKKMPCNFNKY